MREYSPRLVDHFNEPRNMGELENAEVTAVAASPSCGDRLHLHARLCGERIVACTFQALGCAATIAIGSILTEAIAGKRFEELMSLDERRVAELVGGLSPGQRHCAALARDAVRTLLLDCRILHAKGALV